jgi:hypothetical protein
MEQTTVHSVTTLRISTNDWQSQLGIAQLAYSATSPMGVDE